MRARVHIYMFTDLCIQNRVVSDFEKKYRDTDIDILFRKILRF